MTKDAFTLHPSKQKALRLTFSYEGNNIRLISRQKIEKFLPSSDAIYDNELNQPAFWCELTDPKHNILYRKAMDSPVRIDTEVFSNNVKDSIIRKRSNDIRGAFSIVVPDIPNANNFDLFSSSITPEGPESIQAPATKIFHLDLNES